MSAPTHKPAPSKEFDEQALLRAAHDAAKHAYAPYSRFTVGAAVLLEDGRVFLGCNVENVSYGLTNCAERTAIFSAVAASPAQKDSKVTGTKPVPPIRLRAVAVVNGSGKECSPCGACRQVMAEFADGDTVVIYQYGDSTEVAEGKMPSGQPAGRQRYKRMTMRELLPDGFEF